MSSITKEQFEYLMNLRKRFLNDDTVDLSRAWSKEVISLDERESFLIDFDKSTYEVRKMKLNERYRTSIVLIRLCTKKRHTNPDGTVFPDAHVHIYTEEFGDAEAHPVSILGLKDGFTNDDAYNAFMDFCNVTSPRLQMMIES